MGLRAGVDMYEKSCPTPGLDPRSIQPVGSRYTDYAIGPTRMYLTPINVESHATDRLRTKFPVSVPLHINLSPEHHGSTTEPSVACYPYCKCYQPIIIAI